MRERPILFSAPMVLALLSGSKKQTRRVVKPQPTEFVGGPGVTLRDGSPAPLVLLDDSVEPYGREIVCPYGQPGDRLAVRETFYARGHWTKRYSEKKRREELHFVDETMGTGKTYRYEADEKLPRRKRELHEVGWWKRPAIFMPRAASRITLEITSVRVERLQDISEADALAEGVKVHPDHHGKPPSSIYSPVQAYRDLWESIHGPDSWAANPWVWCISFSRVTP